ncbi:MAG: hypothetical protein GX448_12505 [Planctomycetes bacterium]|nr:hypothetical protein [Planctomycetota bacterium]
MRGSNGFEIRRRAAAGIYVCVIASVLFVVCGCGEQLTRMEDNQIKLQAMVAANARELATLSSQIHAGTAKLREGIQNLDTQAQGIAAGVQTVQDEQKQLHETVVAGHQNLDAKAAALREGQQALQTQLTSVQEVGQHTASDVTALAQHQAGLKEMVQANQRELNTHMGTVVSNQQGIQSGITQLHAADDELGRSIASVAGKQDTLSADMQSNNAQLTERLTAMAAAQTATQNSIAANHEQVTNRLAGLADSQQKLHAGVEALDGKMGRMNEDLAAAASSLQQRLATDHDAVATQVAGLAAGQQDLRGRLDALNAKADKAASDSEAAIASLQETLRVGREVVSGQLAVGLQNQQAIQTSVQDLHAKTDGLTANLAGVSAEQAAIRETSRARHDEIITAMAGLSDGHQSLRSSIDQVGSKADQLNTGLTSLASDQKALRDATRVNHEAVLGRLGDLSQSQADLQSGLNSLNGKVDTVTSELSAAAQRQSVLQQSVAENHERLKAAVADLGVRTQGVSADLAALASAQDNFRQQQRNHNEAMTSRTAALAEGQQSLRSQMDVLTATTNQTALSMLTLNNSQATFQQAMQTGMSDVLEKAELTASGVKGMIELNSAMNQAIAAQAAAMTESQQATKADITRMAATMDRAYADLTAVSLAQDKLQGTLTGRSDEISGRVARLDNNQKELDENLNILTATASQTALDVMGLATGHAELQRIIAAGNDAIIARAATLADNQKMLSSQLDVVTETAGQTAADVIGLSDRQDALAGAIRSYSDSTDRQMAKSSENQQRMQSSLDVLTATAGQTAVDVIAAAERQAEFAKAVQNHNGSADAQMAQLAENQQEIQGGLDRLAAAAELAAKDLAGIATRQDAMTKAIQNHDESVASRITRLDENQQKTQSGLGTLAVAAEQTARDLTAVTARQDAIAKAIQSHDESVNSRMARLDESQQKAQSGIEAAATTASQAVRDIAALSDSQNKSEQTAQTGRVEMAARLTEIAQGQQSWIERFDAAQARIQAMADSIAMLDQQLGKIRDALQTGVTSTSEALDANSRQRQQFESHVAQDMQAMIEVLAQLRQTQALLQEQMSLVQKSTQNQADTLKTTIEQLKAVPAAQPQVEVKMSESAKVVEPVVVQTGE